MAVQPVLLIEQSCARPPHLTTLSFFLQFKFHLQPIIPSVQLRLCGAEAGRGGRGGQPGQRGGLRGTRHRLLSEYRHSQTDGSVAKYETWTARFLPSSKSYFAATENKISCEQMGKDWSFFRWLQQSFPVGKVVSVQPGWAAVDIVRRASAAMDQRGCYQLHRAQAWLHQRKVGWRSLPPPKKTKIAKQNFSDFKKWLCTF